jgi:hypothetical protein
MKDFAKFPREELIFFDPGDKVRWHRDGGEDFEGATVIRTARTKVLIKRDRSLWKPRWVPNLHLSHFPAAIERNAQQNGGEK